MKVFYESKLAKWLLWQGYNTITLGCFVFTKKSKEEMKQSTLNHEASCAPMGRMYDCFGCAADGNHAVYRIQLMGISAMPVVVLPPVWCGVRNILHVSLMP